MWDIFLVGTTSTTCITRFYSTPRILFYKLQSKALYGCIVLVCIGYIVFPIKNSGMERDTINYAVFMQLTLLIDIFYYKYARINAQHTTNNTEYYLSSEIYLLKYVYFPS